MVRLLSKCFAVPLMESSDLSNHLPPGTQKSLRLILHRVSIFQKTIPSIMGFQISADAFKAPIQFNNVFPMGLEYIGIEVVWVCSEMRADGLICSIRYDSHSVIRIPEPFVSGCSSVTRYPTRQVASDRVCVLLTLDCVRWNGLSMFCIVSFVENTIDDRTAGTVPFDGSYAANSRSKRVGIFFIHNPF